ncbi:MAG: hypothetical protein R6W82_02380 [bacterium]
MLKMIRRRKVALTLLLLALPYGFAGTASAFLHHHQDPYSLQDPQCPSCNFQKLTQDANADAATSHLLPRPEQTQQDLTLHDWPAAVESTVSLFHPIRAPPA